MLAKGLERTFFIGKQQFSEFEVIESFKGSEKKGQVVNIDMKRETSCQGPANSSYVYLLYVYKKGNEYSVTRCGAELFQKIMYKGEWYGLSKVEVEKRLVVLRKLANET